MRILIAGDFVINQKLAAKDCVSPEIIKLFSNSDCNIVNLECPITTSTNKIIKAGSHLNGDRNSSLAILKALNIHVAALANNHIKDFDEQGIFDTMDFCHANHIQTVGAGANLAKAAEPLILNTAEGSIAIINIAENEWASAGKDTAGANGMDLVKDINTIKKTKQEHDFVFVIVHGGHEFYNLPSPRMKAQYRFYVDNGADLVVSHHTHAVSGHEIYKGSPIYYGLGHLLFVSESTRPDWYLGLVVECNIVDKKLICTHHITQFEPKTFSLDLADPASNTEINARITKYSEIISDQDLLEKHWDEFINTVSEQYINYWSLKAYIAKGRFKNILNRIGLKLFSRRAGVVQLNFIRCEAHRDVSTAILAKAVANSHKDKHK